MKRTHRILAVLMMTLLATSFILAKAPRKQRPKQPKHTIAAQLTADQRAEIQALAAQLKEDGADRETIKAAVDAKLEEWGVTIEKKRKPGRKNHSMRDDLLTEDQKKELAALAKALKEQGLEHQTIHDSIQAVIVSWGIDLPEPDGSKLIEHLGDKLTTEQQEALQALIAGMQEDGATHKEIHKAVRTQLKEYGIKPERKGQRKSKSRARLTDEQKLEIQAAIKQMKEEGASKEEVAAKVKEMIQAFQKDNDDAKPANKRVKGKKVKQIRNRPNPFNPETTISYELQEPGQVTVAVYNIQGQRIVTLTQSYQTAGVHQVMWNGKNQSGTQVPSGVYLMRVDAHGESHVQRMLMAK